MRSYAHAPRRRLTHRAGRVPPTLAESGVAPAAWLVVARGALAGEVAALPLTPQLTSGNQLRLTWKQLKPLVSGSTLPMSLAEGPEDLFRLASRAAAAAAASSRRAALAEAVAAATQAELGRGRAALEEAVAAFGRNEAELYGRFAAVLNTKKARIQELLEERDGVAAALRALEERLSRMRVGDPDALDADADDAEEAPRDESPARSDSDDSTGSGYGRMASEAPRSLPAPAPSQPRPGPSQVKTEAPGGGAAGRKRAAPRVVRSVAPLAMMDAEALAGPSQRPSQRDMDL